ncbi:MAG TPA: hypothetical protein VK750_05935 [Cytophagaceae bacterium]|nr:hypothetical protein [Cytophagaceae bacterium]
MGKEEHIYDMFENGTLYCRALQVFRKIEDGNVRGDKHEGAQRIINSPPGSFEIPTANGPVKINYEKLHLVESQEGVYGNVFCLYAVTANDVNESLVVDFDPRVSEFGTHALAIKNMPLFFTMLEAKLDEMNLSYDHGLVEYYDASSHSGSLSVFHKPSEYAYQKEFRLYIQNEDKEHKPLTIQLGSLKEISEVRKIILPQ